jgi:hypothetical protein
MAAELRMNGDQAKFSDITRPEAVISLVTRVPTKLRDLMHD